ncbi:MAG: Rrf2 family transcriptional regulator [Candidatus Adiutrix sp.]|jgi:Rrf2 family protein|nr:Rrf2 family transcriptional regulator [Candidatus Adiutrix sp.]
MAVSLKCQYALRALFALARHEGEGLLRISEIAEEQDIPPRYLENICNQLRQGGFVEGKRGKEGGFLLSKPARDIRVGDIIRFIEGPMHPTNCAAEKSVSVCRFKGKCAFMRLWNEAEKALESVYDSATLRDLVEEDKALSAVAVMEYYI